MNIFAIDLGNKKVKMKSGRAEYSYPSSYMTTDFLTSDSVSAHQEVQQNKIYKLDDKSKTSFVWGEALEIYNLPENMIDTYARVNRIKQKKTQRILEFALGRLALDYRGEYTEESPLIVHLMLGAPITDMHKNSDTLSILNHLLIGKHHMTINGEEVWIDIPSEDYISVIPQYMGSLLDLAFDNNLNQNEVYSEGKIGIVDIGGGTILINSSNALNLSPLGTEKFYGIQTLIKEITTEINSTKPFIIEKLLSKINEDRVYLYKTSRNEKDTQDISEIVNSAIENYTRFTIAPLLTENFADLEEFDLIVMTGGGAALLSKTVLLDEIGDEYFDRLVFSENSERSNVRGFYKGALIKWEDNNPLVQEELMTQKIEEDTIFGKWGTSEVEFTPSNGVLKVKKGHLSPLGLPVSIVRSEIKIIKFLENVVFPANSSSLFGGKSYMSTNGAMSSLKKIEGMEQVSTASTTDMSFMFNGCKLLSEIDLSNFDTSEVENFSNMFANCENLVKVNLKSFNTSKVKNFDSMFLNCTLINNLNLQMFNMDEAQTKIDMFEGCVSLNNLSLPAMFPIV